MAISTMTDAGMVNRIRWADAELKCVTASYDSVTVEFKETTGERKKLICHGHIGYAEIGVWDETIIERAEFVEDHDFTRRCVREIEGNLGPTDSGSPERNRGSWTTLVIVFIDGHKLNIAANSFSVEPLG